MTNIKPVRFPKEENGILYLVTNWKMINGKIVFSKGKCWKFPMKKRNA